MGGPPFTEGLGVSRDPQGCPWDPWAPGEPTEFLAILEILDFSKNRFFSLFNRSGGPGTIKIEFSIKKYPWGLIYSFRSWSFH